nr:uncharacterized protein LOC115494571 [Taeniopygia guttata]
MAGTRQLLPLRSPSSSSPTAGRPRWRRGLGRARPCPRERRDSLAALGLEEARSGARAAGAGACGGSGGPAGGGQAGRHGDRRPGGAGSRGLSAPGSGGRALGAPRARSSGREPRSAARGGFLLPALRSGGAAAAQHRAGRSEPGQRTGVSAGAARTLEQVGSKLPRQLKKASEQLFWATSRHVQHHVLHNHVSSSCTQLCLSQQGAQERHAFKIRDTAWFLQGKAKPHKCDQPVVKKVVIMFIPKAPDVTPGNQDAVSQELTVLRLESTKMVILQCCVGSSEIHVAFTEKKKEWRQEIQLDASKCKCWWKENLFIYHTSFSMRFWNEKLPEIGS